MKDRAVVFVHIGPKIPDHAVYALEQIRKFYTGDIWFLVEERVRSYPAFEKYGIKTASLESLTINNEPLTAFRKAVWFPAGDFWYVTYERLFFLQKFMEVTKYDQVLHLENDVMNYIDLDSNLYWDKFAELYPDKMAINPVGDKWSAIAYTYIDNVEALTRVNKAIIELSARGVSNLQKLTGEDLVSEMIVLDYLRKNQDCGLDILPCLPIEYEGCNRNFDNLQVVFDGASWGQYVFGTTDKIPGWTGSHHYVGREIQAGKYKVIWKQDTVGRKCPWIELTSSFGVMFPLANLHVHSKQLQLGLS